MKVGWLATRTLMLCDMWFLAAIFLRCSNRSASRARRARSLDDFDKVAFFGYRMKGVEPSKIPADVADAALAWTDAQPDERVFKIERKPDYQFNRVKGSFNKVKCSQCGEYVFERYARLVNNELRCIPCSGY